MPRQVESAAVARIRYYTAKRAQLVGELASAERDIEVAAINLVLPLIKSRLDATATDALGMIEFGGRWLERDRIWAGIRELLACTASDVRDPSTSGFSAPTVSLKREAISAPFHDDPPHPVPICSGVVAFADGELTPDQADIFRAHLPGCKPCQTALDDAVFVAASVSPNSMRALTLDYVYPITEPHLTALRDETRNPYERIEAARWLLEKGFADHHLLDVDVRAAARGELPRAMRAAAPTPPAGAAAVRDKSQTVRAEFEAVVAELQASGTIMVACQPMYDQIATMLALRIGSPVVITQNGVPPSPGVHPKLRVRALGVEIVAAIEPRK